MALTAGVGSGRLVPVPGTVLMPYPVLRGYRPSRLTNGGIEFASGCFPVVRVNEMKNALANELLDGVSEETFR
jgi:hypothetical protein